MCRAISTALGIKYSAVDNLLKMTAAVNDCDKLCLCCYHHLIEDVFGYTPIFCSDGQTVGDIAVQYAEDKVIIRIEGHLTCSLYGTVLDIWDCSGKKADCYWIVK